MGNIAVSIVVPVYNAERFLDRCIHSLLSQSLKAIEILLIDDGSNDKSGKICDDYLRKDNRITVIHSKNGGPAKARNEGIKLARGMFVGFVDSDDWVDENMFEEMYDHAINSQSDMVICDHYIVADDYKHKYNYINTKPQYVNNEIKDIILSSFYNRTSYQMGLNILWN